MVVTVPALKTSLPATTVRTTSRPEEAKISVLMGSYSGQPRRVPFYAPLRKCLRKRTIAFEFLARERATNLLCGYPGAKAPERGPQPSSSAGVRDSMLSARFAGSLKAIRE